MAVDPPGDPFGPQHLICLPCTPRRGDDGQLLRDENGDPIRDCDACVGRTTDRQCECTWCPWLEMT